MKENEILTANCTFLDFGTENIKHCEEKFCITVNIPNMLGCPLSGAEGM